MTFKAEYFPDEIADTLCLLTGTTNDEQKQDVIGALYDIHTICENRYNNNYWRTFYNLLERVVYMVQVKEIR